jgi:hypothetical protein
LNQSSQIKTQGWNFPSTNSQRTVVKVIDQETKEVLRQIPTKEALALAKAFDSAKGSPDQPKRRHATRRGSHYGKKSRHDSGTSLPGPHF